MMMLLKPVLLNGGHGQHLEFVGNFNKGAKIKKI
jgi:hypothetical protein